MIVKFLRPASSFKGVGYSFTKMLLDKGELMEVKNFGALAGLSNLRAADYVNYLEAVTDKNKRIVYPQLHVTISTKGRDHTKSELTGIAEKWLEGMGYGPPVAIFADRDKISSVIANIIANAVKYSPNGTDIKVRCEIANKNATVSVNDKGIGIAPEDVKKIFDRYYRVQSSHSKHISGFGIGIYLSAEIINRHEGRIWAESEIGKGSTFYFSLPL